MRKMGFYLFFILVCTCCYADFKLPNNLQMSKISDQKLSLEEISAMLNQHFVQMKKPVINKVLLTLKCTEKNKIEHSNTLAVIDYSLPASKKRFWVFNLNKKELLFHTYVSHGIKSGELYSEYFSNRHNSRASSIGVFKTLYAYYGRYGYSLRLSGLERYFNNNARGRAIVMHGGWYMSERFIQKYGRPGRSWGCPAIPIEHTKGIINQIKNDALVIAYYPDDNWFIHSKFLNCDNFSHVNHAQHIRGLESKPIENRQDIVFVEKNNNDRREENEPILVITADAYKDIFNASVPLKRMLRRKINNMEYIALSQSELKHIVSTMPTTIDENNNPHKILFVIPVVRKLRGYNATEMKVLPLGKIKAISEDLTLEDDTFSKPRVVLHLENKPPLSLKTTKQFIRWLGL